LGHLFVLCGPPGSGKTTLLKKIQERDRSLKMLQRISTREPRPEEGHAGRSSLEYEFLDREEFASRLARSAAANLIEWNDHFYATELDVIHACLESKADSILYEDMPSALHLRRIFGSQVTVVLLFVDNADELRKLEFATLLSSKRESIQEWRRRLGMKYDQAEAKGGRQPTEAAREDYSRKKMERAIVDLAFMVGRLRKAEDMRVLANLRDQQEKTYDEFHGIVEDVRRKTLPVESARPFAFVIMPFKKGEFDKIYRYAIKPVVDAEGLQCLRGDEISSEPMIFSDVQRHIERAELVIADISGGNPNVFLELGISLRVEKPIVIISQGKAEHAPFDVKGLRLIEYDNTADGWASLSSNIAIHIRKIKTRNSAAASAQ
jgi:guanylate kinase